MLRVAFEAVATAPRSAAEALVHRPAAWLWQCCVRRPYVAGGPPLWLRPHGAGGTTLGLWDTSRAGELFFPLLTMSIYGEHARLECLSSLLA